MTNLAIRVVALGLFLVCVWAMMAAGLDVPVRDGRSLAFVANTPQIVGSGSGRIELIIKNVDGANDAACGTTPAALSITPGPNTGFRLKPNEGLIQRILASITYWCKMPAGGTITYEEVRMVTATPTVTP